MLAALIAFAAPLIATLALTPIARAAALRMGIVDCPDGQRKLQKQPVPLLGGLAVLGGWWLGLAVAAGLGLALVWPVAMPHTILTLTTLLLIGACDDMFTLRARWKLVAQIAATLPIALCGPGLSQVACAGWTFDLGTFGPLVTLVWLILGINALNLIDGMDGMASLCGMCIALAIAALDLSTGGSHVGTFAIGLAGALCGFLVFNFPPARIYLGDAGSMVIGLALALASLRVTRSAAGVTHLTPLVALMALPLTDTTLAIVRRWLSGRGIWYPDRGHMHHRLLDRGLDARRVLALVGGTSVLWGTIIVAAGRRHSEALVWLAAGLVGLLAVRWKLVGHYEWSLLSNTIRNRLRGSIHLPSERELEALDFAAAWQRLQAAVETYPLERLTVSVQQPDGSLREHQWLKEAYAAENSESLVIELVRQTPQSRTCSLRAETPGGQVLPQSSELLEVLERFAHFWAAHPERVPAADDNSPGDDSSGNAEPTVLMLRVPRAELLARRAA